MHGFMNVKSQSLLNRQYKDRLFSAVYCSGCATQEPENFCQEVHIFIRNKISNISV